MSDTLPAPADTDDRSLFDQHLRSFVPETSFDAHAHLYRVADLGPEPSVVCQQIGDVGFDDYQQLTGSWMGDRQPTAGLFFPFPSRVGDRDAANRWLADDLKSQPDARALMLISPQDDPAAVEQVLDAHGFAGFKVYHLLSGREDSFNAEIDAYLPQWAWQLAHERGLAIMLHMVRPKALADEGNATTIRERCLAYPNARLILAHAARGFCADHTLRGIDALRGLDNVWFDTSAVCEPVAFQAILRTFGPSRLMFGTDLPVSEWAGKCVSIADGFLWLYGHTLDWQRDSPFAQPARIGIESLLALKQACRLQRLTDADVERVFAQNARELLGVTAPGDGSGVHAAYRDARQLIPGGTQLLSKRPEMFAPDRWPAYYREARGCRVTDTDGRAFTDMSISGIGACPLGYADPDVTDAVVRCVERGSMATLNSPDEVELARLLVDLHPWAEMVRYTRAGGEAMAAAVRIARARTGRDVVAFCGYHGWTDWYLAANLPAADAFGQAAQAAPGEAADNLRGHLLPGLAPAGVPAGLAGTALPFAYNDVDALRTIVAEHGHNLAAVVMEPTRSTDPQPGFLEAVRQLCDDSDAVLIFDEITVGWRLCLGGAHLRYGVHPDVAVFAKALSNGHPMAAIVGTADVMQAAQETFISSTYWTEAVGPAAALATIRKMQRVNLPDHLDRIGRRMREGWADLSRRHGLPITVAGHAPLSSLTFDSPQAQALLTLFTARMLEHGFLAGAAFYVCLAHEARHVDAYLAAADPVFAELAAAHREGDAERRLGTPVRHTGFARLA